MFGVYGVAFRTPGTAPQEIRVAQAPSDDTPDAAASEAETTPESGPRTTSDGGKSGASGGRKSRGKGGAKGSGARKLLIVESPAKARTIGKFLGSDFFVKASMGHVRDIPTRGRGKNAFGIDFENGYQPTYAPIKGREKTIKELGEAVGKADAVYLAPDPDREGEAIAWHIKEALHLPEATTHRVTFNAITKRAVQESIENPRGIDMNLVNAQQGRRVLDRIVGFSLSPFLWKKVTKGLSAGRVQSVAVRMVVEREREIRAFNPEEFWRITALLSPDSDGEARFEAGLVEWTGERFGLGAEAAKTEASAAAVVDALEGADWTVRDITEREQRSSAPPPFITSTLQQAASTQLRFNTSRTMRVAQQLYEGVEIEGAAVGLITYMRTDSFNIAPEALNDARRYIGQHFAPEYLPEKANVVRSRKGAQEAHEAIRPTGVIYTPERVKAFLSPEQQKLYELIWRRFVASQMTPAVYRTTTAKISAGEGLFEAKGRRVVFDGYTALAPDFRRKKAKDDGDAEKDSGENGTGKSGDQDLPKLSEAEALRCHELTPTQHFTQPPPRYSEASLVRALEKEGIGRPSTYAPIIQTIQERGYVRQEKRRFHATQLGMAVTDILVEHFPQILDLNFTAGMEEKLDRVEEGEEDWVRLIDRFYKPFQERLDTAKEEAEPLKGQPAPGGETCPECGGEMVIRYSKSGAFLGCSKYPDCKGTIPLPGEGEGDGEEDDVPLPPCPACGAAMTKKRSRFGVFLGCSKYPDCKQTIPLDRSGKPANIPTIPEGERTCPVCGGGMQVTSGRAGAWIHCPDPACAVVRVLKEDGTTEPVEVPTGVTCEKCQSPMIVRVSRRGPFLACSAFPKCRNTLPIGGRDEAKTTTKKRGKKKTSKKKTTAKKTASKKTAKKKTSKTTKKQSSASDES
jgi:DNA topoisomerase-1